MPTDARVLDDRYELRTVLGEGAMGRVWHAHDRVSRQAVAVKLMHPHPHRPATRTDRPRPEELVERFRREAEVVERFDHPGIPRLYEARIDRRSGSPYLVMELVLGEDLGRVLETARRLPVGRAVAICVQICDILDHVHADPVVHRDLKPANIMLTGEDRVKLLDFGVAAVFGSAHRRLTVAGQILGTLAYMAPEQFDAGRIITPRTDLYALGCVMYQLLTGEPPFTGEPHTVMHGHHFRLPKPPRESRPEIAPGLDALVLATLAKEPDGRPVSARAVRDGLVRFLDHRAGQHPAPAVPRAARRGSAASNRPSAALPSVRSRIAMAAAAFDAGHLGRALVDYAQLADELAGAGPDQAYAAAECRARAAHCRMRLGDGTEALKEFRCLAERLAPSYASQDPLLLYVRRHVGLLLEHVGEAAAALAELAEVYPELVDLLGKDAPETAEVRTAINRIRLRS